MNSSQTDTAHFQTSEIIQLTNQRQVLSEKVDQWNNWMLFSLVLTLLAAAAVLLTTRMVVFRSRQLAGLQDRLQTVNDAQATAEKLRLEHALSAQQERTANAEMALLDVQQKVRGREVTPKQVAELTSLATGRPKGVVTIQKLDQDPEAVEYARQLVNALAKAGWTPEYAPGTVIGGTPIGLSLGVYSQLRQQTDSEGSLRSSSSVFYGQALKDCLQAVGIGIDHYKIQSGPPIPRDGVYLSIGHKP